jgi:photosystem II stability/assembly factor-like uncharacterized protein
VKRREAMTRVIYRWVMVIGVLLALVIIGYSKLTVANKTVASKTERQNSIGDALYDVCFVERHGYAVGYYGTILYSPDRGETWELQKSGAKELLTAVAFVDGDNGWVTGTQGTILSTSDGGKTWRKQISGTENDLTAVCFLNRLEGWAVGQSHTILRTADGGKSWEALSTGEELLLKDVKFLDSKKGFVAGEFGTILLTEDGGVTFRRLMGEERTLDAEQLEASHPSLNSIDFTDDGRVGIAVGISGYSLRSFDGGTTWEEIDNGASASLLKVKFIDRCAYVVGLKGTILSMTDNGSHWSKVCLPQAIGVNWFGGIASASSEKIFVVGETGKILTINPKTLQCRVSR